MIVIIDYGLSNLKSIVRKFHLLNLSVLVSSSPEDIKNASKLILPGVGAFAKGMNNLKRLGIIPAMEEKVRKEKTPILGICLGMQLFSLKSEEGNVNGLGWINCETVKFKFENSKLKIPHIGWNTLEMKRKSPLLEGISEKDFFYFVHSYHVKCEGGDCAVAQTHYGHNFTSVIQRENIFGTQFHPEKSHKAGLQILKNFVENV